MNNELLLSPTTKQRIEAAALRMPHALLIVGPVGAGKSAVGGYLADLLIGAPSANHPSFHRLTPESGSISIESIRRLQQKIKLKPAAYTLNTHQVILVEDAHRLTIEAQNAFLKLLEEPPDATVLILTATTPGNLLPTIVSRVQQLSVVRPSLAQAQAFYTQKSATEIEKAYALSDGWAGQLHALLMHDHQHPLIKAVEQVKRWLGMSTFERLSLVDELVKQKDDLGDLLTALERTAHVALGQAAKSRPELLKRWHKTLSLVLSTEQALARNVQTKLVLTRLMLEL